MKNNYLIALIRNYQDDYYTKHKATEIFEEITSLKGELRFPKEKFAREFEKVYQMLGQVHMISDMEEFSSNLCFSLDEN